MKVDKAIKKWKISRLKEHPDQAMMFGDLSEEELTALATDMQKNGQRQPVEILADGTIIAGHQRVRAARRLGWKEIEVIVRTDLAEASSAAAELAFITDNLYRRHLSGLARARGIKRVLEIEAGCRPNGLRWDRKEELKSKIAAQLHLSLRSVNRYLLILQTPTVVQQAFDQGHLSLVIAGKIALLPKKDQQEIARRIQAGERASRVAAEFLQRDGSDTKGADASFVRLVRMLKRELPWLTGQEKTIGPDRLVRCREIIQEAVSVLNGILRRKVGLQS